MKYTVIRLEDTDTSTCWLCEEARAEYCLDSDGEAFKLCTRCVRMTQGLADVLGYRARSAHKDGQS